MKLHSSHYQITLLKGLQLPLNRQIIRPIESLFDMTTEKKIKLNENIDTNPDLFEFTSMNF